MINEILVWNKDQDESKFNHTYISNAIVPDWSSDINEEVSLLGTERTSELTTEHCSYTKNWQSQKPSLGSINNQPVYKLNLPNSYVNFRIFRLGIFNLVTK